MTQMTIEQAVQLALHHHRAGDLATAQSIYEQILAADPNNVDAIHLLGLIAHQRGDNERAVALMGRSVELAPTVAHFHANYGEALRAMARGDEAIAAYRRAIELNPTAASPWNNLGIVLAQQGRHDEAIEAWRRAIALQSDDCRFHDNLGTALQEQGKLDEAIACHERAIQLNPDFVSAYSNLIGTLKYNPATTPQSLLQQHLRFAAHFAEPLRRHIPPHTNSRDPNRPLRIGYVSPDFRRHSVAYFLEPILRYHDRRRFEIYCYWSFSLADEFTERFRACASVFRSIVPLDDEQAAQLVRADGIDILVDLAGHTACGRPLLFARKPAPVQVSYLGHPCTMGLWAIEYRITDARADPPGMTEAYHTETLVRLPRTFLCYQPSAEAPSVSPPPCDSCGQLTFGSFNNLAKVNPRVIATWSRLLAAVPGSRLLIKSRPLNSPRTVARITEAFAAHGVDASRLVLLPQKLEVADHLATYSQVDVALDTFPYTGTTPTCEAMWMGVPVVVLAGDAHISRVGVSLLTTVGLEELIANDLEQYVSLAARLAGDRQRLRELRAGLRQRLAASPLLDAAGFTSELESAYRDMWRRWCESG